MRKILIIFGTRPEAIKIAPVINEFHKYPDIFNTIVCVTGQHKELLNQVLNLFEIIPDFDLALMRKNQDLSNLTSRILPGIQKILNKVNPELVIVQGDTTTSMVSSLAAFYSHIPVAHIEAGLRTHNIFSPWPEEFNRSIIGKIAKWHFSPTLSAKQNLLNEYVNESQIEVTGNTAIDSILWAIDRINNKIGKKSEIISLLNKEGYDTSRLDEKRRLILITGHRRENFGEGLKNICLAIYNLSIKYPDVDFVYPVHLNPNVIKPVSEILGIYSENSNVFLMNPLDYLPFVYLMSKSFIILTDSGGVQEEAPILGKPLVVMRETTERPENLEAGTAIVVGTNRELVEQTAIRLLNNPDFYKTMTKSINPFGDGKAAERIVSFILNLK